MLNGTSKTLLEIEIHLFGEALSRLKQRLSYDPQLGKMWEIIEHDYERSTLTLIRAATKCGMKSGNTLNERLRRYGPYTFHTLLAKYRVYRAVVIFSTTDAAILDVALAVGIDQSTLDRAFKHYLDMSPKEWRKHCREGLGRAATNSL